MTRMVQCAKLKKELPGLTRQPYPGELGKKIFNSVSNEAWQSWISQQTILINEYRLSLIDAKAQSFLKEEMEKFLFEGGESFTPPQM